MINLTVFGSAGNIEVVDEKHQKRIRKRRKIEQDSKFALIDLKIVIHKEQFIENMAVTLTIHQESAKKQKKKQQRRKTPEGRNDEGKMPHSRGARLQNVS